MREARKGARVSKGGAVVKSRTITTTVRKKYIGATISEEIAKGDYN